MILFAATVAFLPVTHYTLQGLTVLFATLACGAVGFLDDFIKLTHQRSLGLSRALEDAAARRDRRRRRDRRASSADRARGLPADRRTSTSRSRTSGTRSSSSSSPGRRTATNLADGVDGLAAGTGIIALFTFTAMNVVSYVRSGATSAHRNLTDLDLAIIGAALVGAAIGFLWYNALPGRGDHGRHWLDGVRRRARGARDHDAGTRSCCCS